jgi:hypothetical protein
MLRRKKTGVALQFEKILENPHTNQAKSSTCKK